MWFHTVFAWNLTFSFSEEVPGDQQACDRDYGLDRKDEYTVTLHYDAIGGKESHTYIQWNVIEIHFILFVNDRKQYFVNVL